MKVVAGLGLKTVRRPCRGGVGLRVQAVYPVAVGALLVLMVFLNQLAVGGFNKGLGGVSFTAQVIGTLSGIVFATIVGFVVYGLLKMTIGILRNQI